MKTETAEIILNNKKFMVEYAYYPRATYIEYYKGAVVDVIKENEKIEILSAWCIMTAQDELFNLTDEEVKSISNTIYERFYA